MTHERLLYALKRIEKQLADGYLDITDWPDEDEMEIVKAAIAEYRTNHNLCGEGEK